jgi:hypothetical protein
MKLFLYEENFIINEFDNFLKTCSMNSIILINNIDKNYNDILKLSDKYGDICHDLYPFVNRHLDINIDLTNRFYKNKIIQNVLSKDVCYWIINESEKIELGKCKYNNYDTYISIEKIPSVLNFLLFIINFWLLNIKKLYSCENLNFNIIDIFISKYTKEIINDHANCEESFLTLNINLNNDFDYKDGEIIFTGNEEKIKINQGDMLIYNGKQKRTKGIVSEGVKYVLIIFIELII